MFYLTTHSTHFIYGYKASTVPTGSIREVEGRKEGNVLFNDAHNTFYLRLYGVGHMVNIMVSCTQAPAQIKPL